MSKAAKYRWSLNPKKEKFKARIDARLTVVNSEEELQKLVSKLLEKGMSDEYMEKLIDSSTAAINSSMDYMILLLKEGCYARPMPKTLAEPCLAWQDLTHTDLTFDQMASAEIEHHGVCLRS